jgi:diguanylate cyclase (GGDEF)-like protein/PAS domain S-box-containing protein
MDRMILPEPGRHSHRDGFGCGIVPLDAANEVDRMSLRTVRHRTSRGRAPLWSLLALLAALALGAFVAREHARLLQKDRLASVRGIAERTVTGVRDQLQTCGTAIRAMQAFFMSSSEVTQAEFEQVYENLSPKQEFPALVAFAYARRVEQLAGDGSVTARYPTELIAPLAGNETLLGLDVGSQPQNLRATEISRDTNRPAMSAPFRLVQRDAAGQPMEGLVLRLPVYTPGPLPTSIEERRARFTGTLGASFQVGALMERALPPGIGDMLELRISDLDSTGPALYFNGDASRWQRPHDPDQDLVEDVRYSGRTWRIELRAASGWADGASRTPWVTFAIAVLAAILLALLVWAVASRRERAHQLAERLASRYRETEEQFRSLNELLPVAVVLARVADGRLVNLNQSARRLLGLEGHPTAGLRLESLFEGSALARLLDAAQPGQRLDAVSARLPRLQGGDHHVQLSLAPLEIDGEPHRMVVISDVTELRALNERLAYQASHDALTGLCNRREFERRLEAAIEALDHEGPAGALLYFDLDQFKLINDTSGHIAGDELLAHLARVLAGEIDPRHTLARLGGDEFGLLLADVDGAEAMRLAERLRNAVDGFVFSWEGKTYQITVSIGIVLLTREGSRSLRELLSIADTACYMAKERGRNRIQLYSETDQEALRRRGEMEWVNRLKRALAESRFLLYYQEIQPLQQADETVGAHFELLLRLRDERGELVPPGAFIPAAERYNLMPALDRWVLQTALSGFDRLHPQGVALSLCSINLSGNTLDDDDFPDFVMRQLERTGVAPSRLCFEITETAAVGNMAKVVQFIQRLRALGCRFALDDFGAGMSSFGYLKNLPVDYIKIDGSFIRELETDPMSYSIVRAVTDIGHQVGVGVVAEFVGNARTIALLRGLGVDYAQGYAVHVPAPTGLG